MRKLISLITGIGDWLLSLPTGTKKLIVLGLLGVLGTSSLYKLVISIRRLDEPLPAASPKQWIEPMQKLFHQVSSGVSRYQQSRDGYTQKLDSLARIYVKNNPVKK